MELDAIDDYRVILGELVASLDDLGYITYVFKCLEESVNGSNYVMMTRWPNWQHRPIDIGDIGYVKFQEIQAGVSKWFDGAGFVPYNYDNVQFIKFVEKKDKESSDNYIA